MTAVRKFKFETFEPFPQGRATTNLTQGHEAPASDRMLSVSPDGD
jgi:hypothetical protein